MDALEAQGRLAELGERVDGDADHLRPRHPQLGDVAQEVLSASRRVSSLLTSTRVLLAHPAVLVPLALADALGVDQEEEQVGLVEDLPGLAGSAWSTSPRPGC